MNGENKNLEISWFPHSQEFYEGIKKAFILQVPPLRRLSVRKRNADDNALLQSFSFVLDENSESADHIAIDSNLSYDQTAKRFLKTFSSLKLQKIKGRFLVFFNCYYIYLY